MVIHAAIAYGDARLIICFAAVLMMKDRVSNTGAYFTMADAVRFLADARMFCAWAESLYARRPAD